MLIQEQQKWQVRKGGEEGRAPKPGKRREDSVHHLVARVTPPAVLKAREGPAGPKALNEPCHLCWPELSYRMQLMLDCLHKL